jgi:Na+/melibiose symporter-like transporter
MLVAVAIKYIRQNDSSSARAGLDVTGMVTLGVAILASMLGISYLGGSDASPASVRFVLPIVVAIIAFGLFAWNTRRSATPFIPPKLLHGSGFAVMNIINFLYGSAAFGFAALVPLYATQRFGIRSLESGTLLSARAVGIIAASAVATMLLRRTGYRWPMAVGFGVTAAGLLAMAASPIGVSPYTWLAFAAALTGLGMGVASPATNNASLQLAPEHVAAIAGLRGMFRQAGSITAVSVTTAILARSAHPGPTQGHIFAVFAVVMLCTLPLMRLVPEHRGGW